MSGFTAIDTATSALSTSQLWLDMISHNLANVNTYSTPGEEPFRSVYVVAQERADGTGVEVSQLTRNEDDPELVYLPGHPQADERGYVARPVIDMSVQMTDLMLAQRGLQLNSRVVQSAKDAYEASLRLGT